MVHINIYIIAHLKRQTSDLHVTHQLLLSQHNLNWRGRISSLGKTIIRKFMSMIVEWNIRFQGIWICVCVLLLFFLLVFRFVCDFWIIYVIDKCYGASIFFLVCSFLSLVAVVYYIFEMIFLMVHHLMMNASKFKCSHDVCALLHPSELTFNRNYRKSVVLITATAFVLFFVFVVRTLRFELQQQWKLHRRQDIGEKWHQPLNSIGGGAWTAYKIKPEFNRWVLHLLLLLSPFSRRVIFTRWISDTAFTNST